MAKGGHGGYGGGHSGGYGGRRNGFHYHHSSRSRVGVDRHQGGYLQIPGFNHGFPKDYYGKTGGGAGAGFTNPLPALNLLPFYQPGYINFCGDAPVLSSKTDELTQEQRNSVSIINIVIEGTRTQQVKQCYYVMTILLGIFLIFPLFFLCCEWFKKSYCQLYSINDNDYNLLSNVIMRFPNLKRIQIIVRDNLLTTQKTQIIENSFLNIGRPLYFTFINYAISFDSNFHSLFPGLKAMNTIRSSIIWDTQYYETQNFQATENNGIIDYPTNIQLYGPKFIQSTSVQPIENMNINSINNQEMSNNILINNQIRETNMDNYNIS